uniref:Uncharacterized protein n=1 Tax=Panagrolaimus sp. ES5 TaxID=591445 RepID=A0AC34GBF5_9BILA
TSNARQQKIDRLIDAAEEISNLDERQEITSEQFMERLNDRHEELGYGPSHVYKAWCKILGNVKEFRRPGEPASEAANVREIHIDTTQPDGHVIETEVLPELGNQQIITIEYPIQDEQLKDDFEHIIPQENPPQIEQACAASTV